MKSEASFAVSKVIVLPSFVSKPASLARFSKARYALSNSCLVLTASATCFCKAPRASKASLGEDLTISLPTTTSIPASSSSLVASLTPASIPCLVSISAAMSLLCCLTKLSIAFRSVNTLTLPSTTLIPASLSFSLSKPMIALAPICAFVASFKDLVCLAKSS